MNKKTAATLALCLSMSVAAFGQNQVIHLPQTKASVSTIIKAIEKQTQMSVDFSQNTINLNKTVSLKSKSELLGQLMAQILKDNVQDCRPSHHYSEGQQSGCTSC